MPEVICPYGLNYALYSVMPASRPSMSYTQLANRQIKIIVYDDHVIFAIVQALYSLATVIHECMRVNK
jgi:hypothetical protein